MYRVLRVNDCFILGQTRCFEIWLLLHPVASNLERTCYWYERAFSDSSFLLALSLTFSCSRGVVCLWEPSVCPRLDPLPVELVHVVSLIGVGPPAAVVLKRAVNLARRSHLRRG
jgi:hypothetical protein